MRLHHSLLAVSATVLAFFIASMARDVATQPGQKGMPKFDPVHGSVVASVGDVVAWKRYDPRGDGRSVATYYTVKYYVQHLGGDPALVFEGGDRGRFDELATILRDDTLLLWRVDAAQNSLLWMRDGRIQKGLPPRDAERLGSVMAMFRDGIVAATGGDNSDAAGTTWWVPIRKGEIGIDQRVKMGPAVSAEFLKSADQIAWIDSTHVPAGGEPAGRVPLCAFDTESGHTRGIRIQATVWPNEHLDAFDGHHAIDNTRLIDTTDGKIEEISATDNLREVLRITPLALVVNRAYFVLERFDRFEVMAVPVDDLAHGKIVYHIAKSALAKESLQQHLSAKNLFFASEKTIYAWNGTTWENILAKR